MNAPNDVQVGLRPAGTSLRPRLRPGNGQAGDTVAFRLNGEEVVAAPGETIIEAADRIGVSIPRLCYKPGYRPDGQNGSDQRQRARAAFAEDDRRAPRVRHAGALVQDRLGARLLAA